MLNWEETILHIRKDENFDEVVHRTFLGPNLKENVERYYAGEEFQEVVRLLKAQFSDFSDKKLLDVGSGNGISAVSFAKQGFNVTALEPDPSNVIGAGAIRKVVDEMQVSKIDVDESYAESLPYETGTFDVVHARQALHHAQNLNDFVAECGRVLKPGGILVTLRDHVVDNEQQMEEFLSAHPLHEFYGGEGAFSESEYVASIQNAGLTILHNFGPLDSVLNYYPTTREVFEEVNFKRLPAFLRRTPLLGLYKAYLSQKHKPAGRLHSFIAIKSTTGD